jgi:internalin A
VLGAGESCAGKPAFAVATFADANLQLRVMNAMGVAAEDVTCGRLAGVADLDASSAGIISLAGIQNLTSLLLLDIGDNPIEDWSGLETLAPLRTLFAPSTGMASVEPLGSLTRLAFLDLSDNSIADIGPLAALGDLAFLDLAGNSITGLDALSGLSLLRFLYLSDNAVSDVGPLAPVSTLTTLDLDHNAITDVSALEGLTALGLLDLSANFSLSDVQPLLDNAGLGSGDLVDLWDTGVACPDVNALRAKGVTVDSGCP